MNRKILILYNISEHYTMLSLFNTMRTLNLMYGVHDDVCMHFNCYNKYLRDGNEYCPLCR